MRFRQKFRFASLYLWCSYNFSTRAGRYLQIAQYNFYFNEVYNYLAFVNFHYYYHHIFINFDKGVLEYLGPTGLSFFYLRCTNLLTPLFKQGIASHLFFIYNTTLVYFFIIEFFFL